MLTSAAIAAPGISRTPGTGTGAFWNIGNPTPSYDVAGPAEEVTWTVTGPGGFSDTGTLPSGSGTVTLPAFPDGPGTLTAFPTSNSADSADVGFTRDTVAPTISVAPVGSPNAAGWYRSPLSIQPTCSEATSPSCSPFSWEDDGANLTASFNATDAAGNPGGGTSQPFNYDGTAPSTPGLPQAPVSGSTVGNEPQFRWTQGIDATSGPGRYELEWRVTGGDTWQVIARVDDTGLGDYVAGRNPALRPTPLPTLDEIEWRVRTFDVAGNPRNSVPYRITIDPTVPPSPTITGGPASPIRYTSPTFTWVGAGPTFEWELYIPGRPNPVRVGSTGIGEEPQATIPSLSDGDYTFAVVQINGIGVPSEAATRSFKVDTSPPAAPSITSRPPFPASGVITFSWGTEPGAYSRWQVIGAGGSVILGPSDTPATSISIANLADGAYSFQVLQIDAAGNASATTSEPFTVSTPLAPGAGPAPRVEPEALLPTQNASRLRPKAGRTVPTRRPVLGWRKGPRGTKLYNVQIFRVVRKRAGAAPTVKKIYSGFPKQRQLRVSKSHMKPGTCYVWRVWPYTGSRFTPKPLGISNFCIAKASVLRKKAIAAARRKAAQRRDR